jgi:hypothetical protein
LHATTIRRVGPQRPRSRIHDDPPNARREAARQLANTTKTPPQWVGVTPRWLVSLLPWTPVEAGTYRVNKVKEGGEKGIGIECSPSDGDDFPTAFVDYEEQPREYTLSTVTTTIEVQTRISDLYRSPMDQVREQLGVLIEMVKERQESELVNNANYGLLARVAPSMRISDAHGRADAGRPRRAHREGLEGAGVLPRAPARDRRVRARVHAPRRPAAHGHALRLAVPHLARLPLIPSDKLRSTTNGKTNILLLRTGEKKRGVVGLFQPASRAR